MDSLRLSYAEIDMTAEMARLVLSAGERERLRAALIQMLGHCSVLAEQSLADLEATTHPLATENRLREDTPRPWADNERLLQLAPEVEDRFIGIPNVL